MGGCKTHGPDCAETKGPQNGITGGSLESAGPTSTETGHAKGKKITGWPRAITWDEFKEIEKRPSGVDEDAQIHSEAIFPDNAQIIREKGKFRLGPLDAKLEVDPTDTWVVKTMKQAPLLSHEQGHFDITGLSARDTLKALAAIRAPTVAKLGQRVQNTIQKLQKQAQDLTDQYDDETKHGLDKDQQKRWKDHIRKLMKNGQKLSAPP